ncbi:hypothetical protein ACVIOG_005373 [Rhizobium leguminosarum]|jgi:hypothetical protein
MGAMVSPNNWPSHESQIEGEAWLLADLPTCGGDARQGRGGRPWHDLKESLVTRSTTGRLATLQHLHHPRHHRPRRIELG